MRQIILILTLSFCLTAHAADYVVLVSVDGLGSVYLQRLLDAGQLPNFKKLLAESAGTANARTDYNNTVTLPNHTGMLTSRRVAEAAGHNWLSNTDPANGVTLQSNKGAYLASVFDVVHDHGLRTGLWATKTKFVLFKVSYDEAHGAPDITGSNNGRNKLNCFDIEDSRALIANFLNIMRTKPCQFAFVHFGDTDAAGHSQGWGSADYNAALITLDGYLGQILELIANQPKLKGKTDLILTADHGGDGKNHSDATKLLDYTIPFYVWGSDVTAGDLYLLNPQTRQSPGESRPDYTATTQPVRNADAGNLALSLLGLPPIPGSTVNAKQDLRVRTGGP